MTPPSALLPAAGDWRAALRDAVAEAPRLLRAGDVVVLVSLIVVVVWLTQLAWFGARGDRLIIRSGASVFAQLALDESRDIAVPGSLGVTQVRIAHGTARVVADPGPRQICVRQGELRRSGDAALCAANGVSLEIVGAARAYDTRAY